MAKPQTQPSVRHFPDHTGPLRSFDVLLADHASDSDVYVLHDWSFLVLKSWCVDLSLQGARVGPPEADRDGYAGRSLREAPGDMSKTLVAIEFGTPVTSSRLAQMTLLGGKVGDAPHACQRN